MNVTAERKLLAILSRLQIDQRLTPNHVAYCRLIQLVENDQRLHLFGSNVSVGSQYPIVRSTTVAESYDTATEEGIGDYWSGRDGHFPRDTKRPRSDDLGQVNNQGGWMGAGNQIWKWHTSMCADNCCFRPTD